MSFDTLDYAKSISATTTECIELLGKEKQPKQPIPCCSTGQDSFVGDDDDEEVKVLDK